MVEIVHIILGISSLKNRDFCHVTHVAQVYTNPIVCFLSNSRGIEGSRIIVEHQLGLYGMRTAERTDTSVVSRYLARQLFQVSVCHVIHGILIERLKFQRTRFVSLIASPVFGSHDILYVFFPNSASSLPER